MIDFILGLLLAVFGLGIGFIIGMQVAMVAVC